MSLDPSKTARSSASEPDVTASASLEWERVLRVASRPLAIVRVETGEVIRGNRSFWALLQRPATTGVRLSDLGIGTDALAANHLELATGAHGTTLVTSELVQVDSASGHALWGLTSRTDAQRDEAFASLVKAGHINPESSVIWLDRHGLIQAASHVACLQLGVSESRLIGRPARFIEASWDQGRWNHLWSRLQAATPVAIDALLHRFDGSTFEVSGELHAVPLFDTTEACFVARDVSELRRSQRDLRDSEARYALAARGANDGLWDWNIASGHVYYSARWCMIHGVPRPEDVPPLASSWLDRVHPEDREKVETALAAHLDAQTEHFESEHRVQHRDGGYRWVLMRGIAVRDSDGAPTRMAGSTTDITKRKNAEARLRYEALHDPLTGLANRALLIKRLQSSLERHRANPESIFAVLFLDVDRFKVINDSLGHTMGDMLLRAVAARLKRCVRMVDTVARLGGDEFMLLLEEIDNREQALEVADRIREDVAISYNLRGYEVYSSVSIGVAFARPDYIEAEDLLRDADIAMYRAKQRGANRCAIFDASMRRDAVQRLTLETDLRRALERGELELFFQPIVKLEDETLKGFEALIRWNHPKKGMVSPGAFIPLAEETGLIVPIGQWVLTRACEALKRMTRSPANAHLSVSVNVSGRQLAHPQLVEQVREVLAGTGVDPGKINLEITESVLMDNAEAAVAALNRLRDLGVNLHIDDFGTGYSSLAYLHRFPIDTLKIDRSFISGDNEEDPWAIVQTIRSLAALLGMTVTAEGVETETHLDKLRELGCDYAQGYLFSRPVPASDLGVLIGDPNVLTA